MFRAATTLGFVGKDYSEFDPDSTSSVAPAPDPVGATSLPALNPPAAVPNSDANSPSSGPPRSERSIAELTALIHHQRLPLPHIKNSPASYGMKAIINWSDGDFHRDDQEGEAFCRCTEDQAADIMELGANKLMVWATVNGFCDCSPKFLMDTVKADRR